MANLLSNVRTGSTAGFIKGLEHQLAKVTSDLAKATKQLRKYDKGAKNVFGSEGDKERGLRNKRESLFKRQDSLRNSLSESRKLEAEERKKNTVKRIGGGGGRAGAATENIKGNSLIQRLNS